MQKETFILRFVYLLKGEDFAKHFYTLGAMDND